MTQSERIYEYIKELKLMEQPDHVDITDGDLLEAIEKLYPEYNICQRSALLESIHIKALESDIRECLREEKAYQNNPLPYVGMSWRDFV